MSHVQIRYIKSAKKKSMPLPVHGFWMRKRTCESWFFKWRIKTWIYSPATTASEIWNGLLHDIVRFVFTIKQTLFFMMHAPVLAIFCRTRQQTPSNINACRFWTISILHPPFHNGPVALVLCKMKRTQITFYNGIVLKRRLLNQMQWRLFERTAFDYARRRNTCFHDFFLFRNVFIHWNLLFFLDLYNLFF